MFAFFENLSKKFNISIKQSTQLCVKAVVRSDRRLTVRMIGSELNLNHNILTEEFGMRKICADAWMLHHDNAVCPAVISVSEFLTKRSIPVVPQPPYSPDLSPCDFFLFPKLKFHLGGRHFGTVDI